MTFPTDYGPDTASDFARIFRLPPGQRPSLREIRERFGRGSKPARPEVPMVVEWMQIPETTVGRYIARGSALTIPDPRGGGDWHDSWRYQRRTDDPPRVAMLSTDLPANPVLAHVLEHVLGSERIIDARPRLTRKGHPDARHDGPPIWAASHERAAIERVLRNTIGRHDPPARDRPEGILDRRTVYRWLPTTEQLEWVGSVLLAIARHLPRERAIAIRGWIENTVDNDAPTP